MLDTVTVVKKVATLLYALKIVRSKNSEVKGNFGSSTLGHN